MFAIESVSVINRVLNDRALVGVFVATGYDQSTIDWLFRSWKQFNKDFGSNWHLFLPTEGRVYGKREEVTPDNFSEDLAEELRELYGLRRDEVPCIVFDNFNDEDKQITVNLRNMREYDLRLFFELCLDAINSPEATAEKNPRQFRDVVTSSILNRVSGGKVGRGAIRALPVLGSISRLFTTGEPPSAV